MIFMVESSLVHAATAALRVPSKSKPCDFAEGVLLCLFDGDEGEADLEGDGLAAGSEGEVCAGADDGSRWVGDGDEGEGEAVARPLFARDGSLAVFPGAAGDGGRVGDEVEEDTHGDGLDVPAHDGGLHAADLSGRDDVDVGGVEDLALVVAMRRVVKLHEEVADVDEECALFVVRIGEAIDRRAAGGGDLGFDA